MTHQQLHNVVSTQIRAAIHEGRLKPGQWLRQMQLAEELGVSQMPVREALKELAAEGLVEHIPYRGVRVIAFTAADIADFYTHRSVLEGMAAYSAATHMDEETLAVVRQLQQAMADHMEPAALAEYRRLNREFHERIYRASGRAYLIRTLDQMWDAFPTMLWGNFAQTTHQSLPERDATDVAEHAAIVQALTERNPSTAEMHMREHIALAGRAFSASM